MQMEVMVMVTGAEPVTGLRMELPLQPDLQPAPEAQVALAEETVLPQILLCPTGSQMVVPEFQIMLQTTVSPQAEAVPEMLVAVVSVVEEVMAVEASCSGTAVPSN